MQNSTHRQTQRPRRGHAFECLNRDGAMGTLHAARALRNTLVAVVTAAAILLPASTAGAGEIPYDSPTTARSSVEPLGKLEAKDVTKFLLRSYLGPAISSDTRPLSMVAAWGCKVDGTRGTCRGAVTGGIVTCRGVFRVHKFPKGYAVFPVRMNCTTP